MDVQQLVAQWGVQSLVQYLYQQLRDDCVKTWTDVQEQDPLMSP